MMLSIFSYASLANLYISLGELSTEVFCSPPLKFSFSYFGFFGCTGVFVAACRFSLVTASGGSSLDVVHGLLIVVACLVAEHRL